jgi:general secretion pathway protein G
MLARYHGNRRQPQSARRTGFTLMEVLLVLVILVVLASMAVQMFAGTQAKADQNAAAAQVGLYKSAIEMFKFDTKQYPEDMESLTSEPSDSKMADRWSGPYMDKVAVDPWDNEYKLAAPGKHNTDGFDVWSMGPDGQDGTDDDIGNWDN